MMKSFTEKSKAAYNKMAADYDNNYEGRFTQPFKEHLFQVITLRDGDTVLDVACGTGSLLRMLASKADINGFGADLSDEMVRVASKANPPMTFVSAGCEHIPFKAGQFDIITVCCAYHHFPDVQAFAKEAQRLLKPGGGLYIAEIYLPAFCRVVLNPFVPLLPDGDVRLYSVKQIVRNFEPFGFKRVDVQIAENRQILCMEKQV